MKYFENILSCMRLSEGRRNGPCVYLGVLELGLGAVTKYHGSITLTPFEYPSLLTTSRTWRYVPLKCNHTVIQQYIVFDGDRFATLVVDARSVGPWRP